MTVRSWWVAGGAGALVLIAALVVFLLLATGQSSASGPADEGGPGSVNPGGDNTSQPINAGNGGDGGDAGTEIVAGAVQPKGYCTESGSISAFPNGKIPRPYLCLLNNATPEEYPRVAKTPQYLPFSAASSINAMSEVYKQEFGKTLCIKEGYRSYAEQVRVKALWGSLAATPGRSNHGWGRAVDFCGGVNRYGTVQHEWMQKNGKRFGWSQPGWALPNGTNPEPWHWEYHTVS